MMDNWERERSLSLSATQLAAAVEKFRQNIALRNLSSQYWLIMRQANTAPHPTALSCTSEGRQENVKAEMLSWTWTWSSKLSEEEGPRGKCEAEILLWSRVLQVVRSNLQCLRDGDKCVCASAKLWIFWILSWSLNILSMVISILRNPGSAAELFFIRNVTGKEWALRNGV